MFTRRATTLRIGITRTTERLRAISRINLWQRARQIRLAWRFILVAMLVGLASIVWLSQTSTIVSYGYNIEKMDKQMTALNQQAEQLQSQVAFYENLARVEEEAKTKLGMIPAKTVIYLKIPSSPIAPATTGSKNSKLAPVNDWWRELTEMLPRPFRGSSPIEK